MRKFTIYSKISILVIFALAFCTTNAAADVALRAGVVKQAEKLAEYLEKAEKYFSENRIQDAREYTEKAMAIDSENKDAKDLLARIIAIEDNLAKEEAERDAQKTVQRLKEEKERLAKFAEQENARRESEKKKASERKVKKEAIVKKAEDQRAKKIAKKAAVEKMRQEVRRKHIAEKVARFNEKSRRNLSEKDFSDARRYAYIAYDTDPLNEKTAAIIAQIDKEELFSARESGEKEKQKIVKQEKSEEVEKKKVVFKKKDDPFNKYDEAKGWGDHIIDMFKKPVFQMGFIQDGREYTIDECVQLAMHRSQRMVSSAKQVKLAEMRLWETRRDLLPTVAGKYELSSGKIGADGQTGRHYRGYKYNVEVKQIVFDGMGTWYKMQQANTNLEIVKLERDKVENEIVEETKKAYYSLDKSIKALEIQQRFKEVVNKLFGITEESFKQELVANVEYLKVKGQNIQGDFQYISAGEDVSLAELVLFQAMNMEPDQKIKIKPVERPKEKLDVGLENCYNLAYTNRPDFKIKEKTIEYYDFERKMMKAKGWPKIEFQGTMGAAYENYSPLNVGVEPTGAAAGTVDWAGEPNRKGRQVEPEWYAGAKGTLPLWGNTFEYNYVREHWAPTVSAFRGSESATSYFKINVLDDLAYYTNIYEARAGFENAKYEYMKAKEDLTVEVKEAYFKYRKSILQIDVAEAKVAHQKMYVDVLEERRKFGEMEISRVVEEYEKLASDEYSLVDGDASYFTSIAQLNKAIGVSEYFKPGYENQEYNEWQKKNLEEAKAEKTKR